MQDCFAVVTAGVEETTKLLENKFDYIFFTGTSCRPEFCAMRRWDPLLSPHCDLPCPRCDTGQPARKQNPFPAL